MKGYFESCKREVTSHIERQTHQNKSIFLKRNSKSKDAWNGVLQALKESNCQPILRYPGKLSFII
jgi:hypothetical protein